MSLKRKALSAPYENPLIRRVRPRREPSEELEIASSEDEAKSEGVSEGEESNNNSDSEQSSSESSEEDKDEPDTRSFGERLKAEAKAKKLSKRSRKSKNGEPAEDNEEPVEDPEANGGTLKRKKSKKNQDSTWTNSEALERKAGRKDHRTFSRPNKHAPTEISSKVPVSRYREIPGLENTKPRPRDPRFDPTIGPIDPNLIRKNYAFLDDYRESEMKALKEEIKKTKDESKKEKLKRELRSMESQKKAQTRKDREQEVLERHKKEEKELVKQGKKPFYLKKKEQKERMLVEEFKGLKGGKLDKVIERRRKKLGAKEKKELPWERRTAGNDD